LAIAAGLVYVRLNAEQVLEPAVVAPGAEPRFLVRDKQLCAMVHEVSELPERSLTGDVPASTIDREKNEELVRWDSVCPRTCSICFLIRKQLGITVELPLRAVHQPLPTSAWLRSFSLAHFFPST
jgi:hypothetical protein